MNYTVEWLPVALSELTDIWLNATDRAAVTAASAQVDPLLAQDPHNNGKYLREDLWQLDVPPIVVAYTIDDGARHVEVSWVRYAP